MDSIKIKLIKMKSTNSLQTIMITLAAFFVPVLVMYFAYNSMNVGPGNQFSILINDLKNQYVEFIASIKYAINGNQSFLYSMSGYMGADFLSQYAYYLANPINIIASFLPIDCLADFLYWITLIKIGLCGVTFCIYLNVRRADVHLVFRFVLSCCYSLMSYTIVYSFHLMWLDSVILLPIILLLVEDLYENRKTIRLSIVLGICIFLNYYTAYMVLIFICLYGLYYSIPKAECVKDVVFYELHIIKHILIGVLLAAPLLVPGIMGLGSGKLSESGIESSLVNFSFDQLLVKFLPCQYDTLGTIGTPMVYVGTVPLLLSIFSFFQRRNIRYKLCGILLIAFFILSLWLSPLDGIWHGFRAPNCFPGRYSFLFSAFILILAVDSVGRIWEWTIHRSLSKSFFLLLMGVVLILSIGEVLLNTNYMIRSISIELKYEPNGTLAQMYDRNNNSLQKIVYDDSLYRVDFGLSYSENDAYLYGVNGTSSFSSAYSKNVCDFMHAMGTKQYFYHVNTEGGTPFLDLLLGVKYKLTASDGVVENDDFCGIAFQILNAEKTELCENPFLNQNSMYRMLSNEDTPLFFEAQIVGEALKLKTEADRNESKIYTITAMYDGPLYFYLSGQDFETVKNRGNQKLHSILNGNMVTIDDYIQIEVNNETIDILNKAYDNHIWYLGDYASGECVKVSVISDVDMGEAYAATFDLDKYNQFVLTLKQNEKNMSYNKGVIAGQIEAFSDTDIMFAVPYMDNLNVYVDGTKVETKCIGEMFLGTNLSAGEHSVVIRYEPVGIWIGLGLFIIGILILVLCKMNHKFGIIRKSQK